jgi:hypothetical protein
MKIKSIKYNLQTVDRLYNGEKLGNKNIFEEAGVGIPVMGNTVKQIEEENITTYMIFYEDGTCKRIFNPIEVNFVK